MTAEIVGNWFATDRHPRRQREDSAIGFACPFLELADRFGRLAIERVAMRLDQVDEDLLRQL